MRFSHSFKMAGFKSAAIIIAAGAVGFAAPASAHDTGYYHTHQSNNNDQLLGGAIGAIAGGVLGSQVAGSGARTEGSVLGAVIGGVAGAAIAGNGNSNRGYSNQGYYNPQTGYYSNGGYYQPPSYSYPTQSYYQPYYPTRTYTTTTYGGPSYYRQPAYNPYYRAPRSGVTISIGNGGYYDRGYARPSYYRGHHKKRRRGRGHHRH